MCRELYWQNQIFLQLKKLLLRHNTLNLLHISLWYIPCFSTVEHNAKEDHMAFTEKDFQTQQEQLHMLQDELSRLDALFDTQKKALGLTENDLDALLQEDIPADVQQFMAQAQDKAKREGAARVAQSTPVTNTKSTKAPGAGRKGAIRL